MRIEIERSSPVSTSSRVKQLESMFDVPRSEFSTVKWSAEIPDLLKESGWQVGLIAGPSGAGKSTVMTDLFGQPHRMTWEGASVIDDFDPKITMPDVAAICQAVGFNTIPAWMRPHKVLSTGEQFRVDLARQLAESEPDTPIVIDEFTSVVDRQVAQIGAYAVQKWVRRHPDRRFIAASCHYDIVDWLQPDWILHMPALGLERRSVQPRPPVHVQISRVSRHAWELFAPFHYLTAELNKAAKCFCLWVIPENGEPIPAAFAGTLHRPHKYTDTVEGLSRIVTLPDWQGLGLAFVLSDALGAAFKSQGKRFNTYPAHPALIRGYDRSQNYGLMKKPGGFSRRKGDTSSIEGKFGGRPCAVFQYVGPAMANKEEAATFLYSKPASD